MRLRRERELGPPEARDSIHSTLAWHVVGRGASGRVIDEVADALAAGRVQPRPACADGVLVEERL